MPDQTFRFRFVARLPWNGLRESFYTSDGSMENGPECYRCTADYSELTVPLFARDFGLASSSLDDAELMLAKRYDGLFETLHTRRKGAGPRFRRAEVFVSRAVGFRSEHLPLDRVGESHTFGTRAACRRLLGDLTCSAHSTSKYLFLSVGSGITQLAFIVRRPDHLDSKTDVLFNASARSPPDFVLCDELIALAGRSAVRSVAICEWDTLGNWWGDRRPRCSGSSPRRPGARGILLRPRALQGRGTPYVHHDQPLRRPVPRKALTSRPGSPWRMR